MAVDSTTKIRIYVDALNFYYGIAKPYGYKWIDIKSLFCELLQQIVPDAEIEQIFFFTGIVKGDARRRQTTYLSALRAKYGDCLQIVEGYMLLTKKTGETLGATKEIKTVRVYEEKETDVNIACQMVDDAYTTANKAFDISCLVCNDSDIVRALMIKKRLRQRVLLICPRTENSNIPDSSRLKKYIYKKDRILFITEDLVKKHCLPDIVGKYSKPPEWR